MLLLSWILRFLGFVLKLVYGFRHEGVENLPREGPYIVLVNEFSMLCIVGQMLFTAGLLRERFFRHEVLSFAGEELWSVPGFSFLFTRVISALPLLPHGAGLLGLHMLEALAHLNRGGVVIVNPEGDMSRDGRPLPVRGGVAWLGLHSAVPLVPVVLTAEAYDTWPTWQMFPSLRGRMVQRIGKPFKLCETPMKRLMEEDVARANARIRAEIDALRYGPDGLVEYTGRPLRGGIPVTEPVRLGTGLGLDSRDRLPGASRTPAWRRGLPLLLWRCPVCHTHDALIHHRPWFRPHSLSCQSCNTRWAIRRVPGKDFRLEVVEGPPSMAGLDMALSSWYDEMKGGFDLSPMPASGVELLAGEELYLKAGDVTPLVYRSSALFGNWTDREPPSMELPGKGRPADWAELGTGTLFLTNRRLIWEGPPRGLDFWWSSVTAVSLRLFYVLTVNYGATPYWLFFGHDNALKWLTYAGTVIQDAEPHRVKKVTLSPY